MCKMTVENKTLSIEPKGLYTKNTTRYYQMDPIIKEITNGNYNLSPNTQKSEDPYDICIFRVLHLLISL